MTPAPLDRDRGSRLVSRVWIWTRRLALGLLALLALVALAGLMFQASATWLDARRYAPRGQMVDAGGHRLHLVCTGEGPPTIVLEAPIGGSSFGWTRVQRDLAQHARVCSYDRAGYGWSEAGPWPRSADRLVSELRALLIAANVPGPYVLVGSSYGGTLVRLFTARHRQDVVGMVLVDATHENAYKRIPGGAEEVRATARAVSSMRMAARFGVLRVLRTPVGEGSSDALPADLRAGARAAGYRTAWLAALAGELESVEVGLNAVAAAVANRPAPAFDSLPLVVVSRGPVANADATEARNYGAWMNLQRDLLRSSSNTTHVVAGTSEHFVQASEPQLVTNAVLSVVRQSRALPATDSLAVSPAHPAKARKEP